MARPVGKQFLRDELKQSASTYPAYGQSHGQDGDPRIPVLIRWSASSAIGRVRVPGHRSTVRPSRFHHPQTSLADQRVNARCWPITQVSLFGCKRPFLRSLIAGLFASLNLLFVRLEAPLFVPAHACCARRAEIGSRRAAGPRAAARSGLDAIEHGARLRSGRAASLPDHGSFRGLPAQSDAGSRNMAVRKAGAPDVPGAVTAVMRAAAEKAESPSLVPAGTPSRPSAGRNYRRLRRGRAARRIQSRDRSYKWHA
jgi:hypothetical protein